MLDLTPLASVSATARPAWKWIVSEVTTAKLGESSFDLWHDRAVFHFLTEEASTDELCAEPSATASVQTGLLSWQRSLPPGRPCAAACRWSGMISRASPRELGPDFKLVRHIEVTHTTPSAREQRFLQLPLQQARLKTARPNAERVVPAVLRPRGLAGV